MRIIKTTIFLFILTISAFAQTATETLATANGRTFTAQDLSPEVAKLWIDLPKDLENARKNLLAQQIEQTLIKIEATKKNLTPDEFIEKEIFAKVPNPTENQIKEIYEANRFQFGDKTLEEMRPKIVNFLNKEPKKQALNNFIETLKKKSKITFVKEVNGKNLNDKDVLATVEDRQITYAEFYKENGLILYEYEANVFDAMKNSLQQVLDSAVYASEAMSLGISTSEFIAREINSKLKEYSDEEIEAVEGAVRKKLYEKYRVRLFINEPKPFIQNISVDNDPMRGNPNATVTVVMFSDFQCPTCANFYPLMKKVIAEYGDKVRLVVRDFPLIAIHENAFPAAVAANAAHRQGKFFEYKELLYKNQDSLDTESLIKYAAVIGLNVEKFKKDLTDEKIAEEIRQDIQDGKNYGVRGTPSVFINGYQLRNLSAKSFREEIEKALKQ